MVSELHTKSCIISRQSCWRKKTFKEPRLDRNCKKKKLSRFCRKLLNDPTQNPCRRVERELLNYSRIMFILSLIFFQQIKFSLINELNHQCKTFFSYFLNFSFSYEKNIPTESSAVYLTDPGFWQDFTPSFIALGSIILALIGILIVVFSL